MIIHWFQLLGALLFGLIPPRQLINSECRYLKFDEFWAVVVKPRKSNQRRRRWWKLPIVWIDPVRGYVIAFLLADAFAFDHRATSFESLGRLAVTFMILLLIAWIQTCGRNKQKETLAPTGFLAGLMLGLLPPVIALSGIVLGVVMAIATTSFPAGYLVAALTTAGIGYAFMGTSIHLAASTLVMASPLLISWMRRAPLVIPVRC